uniref:Ribosomal RNA-processing protein 14/surfeit locus protein 6 C-terminal domain-containing protein n=1 Tax=Polytomella parva TaxID=51329 RepID=A0A7S0V549_9CHLO
MTAANLDKLSSYFDSLAELVPAKFFYDNDEPKVNTRFLAKAAREAAKKEFKENYKKGKFARLDPEGESVSTLQVQKQLLKQSNEAKLQENEGAPGLKLKITNESRQQLLEKLHKRMEEARLRRNAQEDSALKAKEWKERTLTATTQKRKSADDVAPSNAAKKTRIDGAKAVSKTDVTVPKPTIAAVAPAASKPTVATPNRGGNKPTPALIPNLSSTDDFAFSKLEGDNGKSKTYFRPERASKEQVLKQLQTKKEEQETLKSTAEGKDQVQSDAWQAALNRARGEKVLDDPKMLKRSIKRDAKKREKSAKAWKERKDIQESRQAAKQSKRKDNLKARTQAKMDKKKERREKKLLRAGFEGRKQGFIGGKASKTKTN